MKKIAAFGLAALMAVGASLASSGGASAKPNWMMHPHPAYPMMRYHQPGFYLSIPFFGFRSGPPLHRRYVMNRHVEWCLTNYRTYNPYTDTYHPKVGVTAVCVSPWWTY